MKSEILKLAMQALDDIDSGIQLSRVIQKSIRIAKLKKDYENLFWLEMEMISGKDGASLKVLGDKIKNHLSPNDYMAARDIAIKSYTADRYISDRGKNGGILGTKTNIDGRGVAELEGILSFFKDELNNTKTPEGLHQVDLYFVEQKNTNDRTIIGSFIHEFESILARIQARVFQYISDVESEILHENFNPDILERDEKKVFQWISKHHPDIKDKIDEAKKRISENTSESRAHALTTIRRVLKDVADIVYPATNKVIKGDDGIEREMSDDKYLYRINQFFVDKIKDKSRKQTILSTLTDFSNRLQKLYDLSSKGVHDNVSESEVVVCYKQTIFFITEVLKLYIDNISDQSDK